jgi:hypothetical protein
VRNSAFNSKASKHEKFIYSDYARNFMNLYKLLGMDSGAKNFTETIRHDMLSTVMFSELIYA